MDKLYSVTQAAERFGVTHKTVRLWIKQGKLKAIKLNARLIRISESAMDDFCNLDK